jgi:lipid II:glycine glycyltransferase (peptidoglycan interpeptide bridge formation enzyme)
VRSGPRVFEQAVEYGRARRWRYIEWRGGKCSLAGAAPSLEFYGHRLDLGVGERGLFERVGSSTRRAVRKAQAAGLTVRVSDSLEAVGDYYWLHCRTRQRHGLPPQPYAFFLHIHRQIISKGLGMVVQASYDGRPIASAVFLWFGKQAVYKFGASDQRFQRFRANDLVMWEGIKGLVSRGLGWLSFGRTSLVQEGLRRFKQGWGAQEQKIEYFKYDLKKAAFITEIDRVSGWYNLVFKHLPRGVSRLASEVLYRHLA